MNALALILKPIEHGWSVSLTNGRELARFTGFGAKRRAIATSNAVHREGGRPCVVSPDPTLISSAAGCPTALRFSR